MKRNEMTKEQKKRNDLLIAAYEKIRERAKKMAEKGMTQYQLLMAKSEHCENIALIMYNAKETSLAAFYKKASIGYENKARNLIVGNN